jgi:hypothetical protein
MEASPEVLQVVIALVAGIALSASCGFRVFIPPLIVSLASMAGFIDLGADFGWMGTWQAALVFAVAAVCEIAAYYIPALDNLLDTIAVPAAAIAGTILTASFITGDVGPAARWVLAVIAGGGTALTVSGGTSAIRGASTVTTAGLGNGLVATSELMASVVLSILSLLAPVFALVLAIIAVAIAFRVARRVRKKRQNAQTQA